MAETTTTVRLTGRQRDVAALAAAGQGPKDMARTLKLSIRTVTVHLQGVYALLGLKGYGSLLRFREWARQNGYGQQTKKATTWVTSRALEVAVWVDNQSTGEIRIPAGTILTTTDASDKSMFFRMADGREISIDHMTADLYVKERR